MKLKSKRTGEIGELQVTEKHCAVAVGNGTASCGIEVYSSLAQLFKEWEDVPEEAEKVVEKLKAWKRLKDKGFKFDGWSAGLGKNKIYTIFWSHNDGEFDLRKDLDLLFSGGEE